MDKMGNTRKGCVLAVDAEAAGTKVGLFIDGECVFEDSIAHDPERLASFNCITEQEGMRKDAVLHLLKERRVALSGIDIVMARGGLCAPVLTGVYKVNGAMRGVLESCRDGVHACNLSALVADDIASEVRSESPSSGCEAYIADAPMADEMLPECRIGGLPEFPRRAFFHDLNSRAALKRYLADSGKEIGEVSAVVAHLGHGITVSLHRGGRVIDTNNGLGGEGPFTMERAGTCPAFPLVEMCFSGKYTEAEVKMRLMGHGGAVAYFGTADPAEIISRAESGDRDARLFLDAYCLNVAKSIASEAAVEGGKIDAVILTGNCAAFAPITEGITRRVSFIAPVVNYPGEHNVAALAENGYAVLSGEALVHSYSADSIVPEDR